MQETMHLTQEHIVQAPQACILISPIASLGMAARRALFTGSRLSSQPSLGIRAAAMGRVSPNAPAHDEIEMAGAGAFRAKTRFWVLAQGGLDRLVVQNPRQNYAVEIYAPTSPPDNEIGSPQTQRELSEPAKRIIV